MLDIILPGTGGMLPSDKRWLSCCWLESQGRAVLIDCGEGTQIALKNIGCRLGKVDILLITHFHADHVSGLPGLLLSLGNYGKTTPLLIAGPRGLQRIVSALLTIAPVLPFSIEMKELNDGDSFNFDNLRIDTMKLRHSALCLGYRITLNRKPVFNPQKAAALNIPVTLYKVLHSGNSVILDDGREITPEMVLDGERSPISVCYFTDTKAFEKLSDFARDSDLLIAEGMHGDDSMREKIREKGHMLFSESARIAKEAGVKRLWFTHYSPALTNPNEYIGAARKIFPNATAAYDGISITLPQE